MDTRGGMDEMEKRKFLTLLGVELRRLSRPPRGQSLYRLCYPGSIYVIQCVEAQLEGVTVSKGGLISRCSHRKNKSLSSYITIEKEESH
jgi:hypothetical protein